MRALHFGAGNIGRGFIGKLLSEAGFEVVFADVVPILINELSARKRFKVNVVGEKCSVEEVVIHGAVFSNRDDIFEEIEKADLLTTAVGPRILERLAPTLAKGIIARKEKGIQAPLNIVACENAIRATTTLKEFVLRELDEETIQWSREHIGFVDCAVDRIVPPARHEDPLEVTVEDFCEWVVDETQFAQGVLRIPNVKYTANLAAFVERKLMTVNTGHAITAYLGKRYGYADIRSSIGDPVIRKIVEGAMRESGAVLIRRYNMDPDEHEAYIQKILRRYANPYIVDDVLRVGREPLRKLSPEDRLIKPLRGCIEYKLPFTNLAMGVAAALLYDDPNDPQAVELQQRISVSGWDKVFEEVSGLQLDNLGSPASKVRNAVKELGQAVGSSKLASTTAQV